MGATIVQKVLQSHSGSEQVRVGEYVWVRVDNTNGYAPSFQELEEWGVDRVFDPEKVWVVNDHSSPPANVEAALQDAQTRKYVKKYNIRHFFEYGRHGIAHQIYAEHGCALPGDFIAMGDSHALTLGAMNAVVVSIFEELPFVLATGTLWLRVPESVFVEVNGGFSPGVMAKDAALWLLSTYGSGFALYKALEFHGPGVDRISVDGRMTICNMATEMGAKAAIFPCDSRLDEFLRGRASRPYAPVAPDADAEYSETIQMDLNTLEPMVAIPDDPGNGIPAREASDIVIDQVFIGSCTNGRFEDLEVAAKILRRRRVADSVRLIVSPASCSIWRQALREGIFDVLCEAGALICHPTCGPCCGSHMGVLADGERCASTTNRNYKGRMGSPLAEVYLVSPATAAASAVTGRITDPREFLG